MSFKAGDTVFPGVDGKDEGKEGEEEENGTHSGEETCSDRKKKIVKVERERTTPTRTRTG